MKTKYILIIGLLITLMSCDDDFLEQPPLTVPASNTFYANESAAIMGVNGVYQGLHKWPYILFWEDQLTDNERWNVDGGNALYGGLAHGTEAALGNNSYTILAWYRGYILVQRANKVIESIEPMDNLSDDLKNRLIAECKFLRANGYHLLVWRFGDVPLLLNPTSEQDYFPVRTPKAEVVEQIYADLTDAAQYLPETWTGSDIGRVTKGAALGMLAKEYLFNGEWVKAAQEAKKVMDISAYGLVENYDDLWLPGSNNTKEDLFKICYWTANGEFSPTYFYYRWLKGTAANTGASGQGWCLVVQDLVNAFENSDGTPFDPAGRDLHNDNTQYENRDPRLKSSIFVDGMDYFGQPYKRSWTETDYSWRKYTIAKNDPNLVTSQMAFDWKVLRYAEVLLIYAEAKNETEGPVNEVYNAVNQVRNRVGMPDLPVGLTKDAMRERIYNERRVELCSEATRYEDLVRWRRLKEVMEKKHYNQGVNYQITNFEEFRYLWPIPQTEIDINANLTQNSGY